MFKSVIGVLLAITLNANTLSIATLTGEPTTTINTTSEYLDYVGTNGVGLPVTIATTNDLYYSNKPSDKYYLVAFRFSMNSSATLADKHKKVFLSWSNYVGDESKYSYAMPKLFFDANRNTINASNFINVINPDLELFPESMGENFAYIDGEKVPYNSSYSGVFVLAIPNVQRVYQENYEPNFPLSNFRLYATILDAPSNAPELATITFFTANSNVTLVRYNQNGLRQFELLPIVIYNQNLSFVGVTDIITRINVDNAYNNGYTDGLGEGYNNGYDDGRQSVGSESNLLSTAITAPIGAILYFLGAVSSYEFFGVSIALIVGLISAFGIGFLLIKLLGRK